MKLDLTIATLFTILAFIIIALVVSIIGYALFNGHIVLGVIFAVIVFFAARRFFRKMNKA